MSVDSTALCVRHNVDMCEIVELCCVFVLGVVLCLLVQNDPTKATVEMNR
jgi:hypothetical protein